MDETIYERLQAGLPLVWVVDQVLSAAECQALIDRIERAGPEPAPVTTATGFMMMPGYRNNDRVMFDDRALAQTLFERVAHTLPPTIEGRAPVGANERLRSYRYRPGHYFKPHFDGSFTRGATERSELTLIVYLNGGVQGGETDFPDLEQRITPVAGRALLFFHQLLHEGRQVHAGLKYALRTDVMYGEGSCRPAPVR